jgi:hypothetical protein
MGYLTVLYVGLGIKIRDLHAKDSYSFCNKQIVFKSIAKIKIKRATHTFGKYIITARGIPNAWLRVWRTNYLRAN